MAAPNGCWDIMSNGFRGVLLLAVEESGQVTGTMYGNPIRGFWHEAAQKLIVYRLCSNAVDSLQVFTGYQFPGGMAGSFEAFAGSGAEPARNVFGWYATPADPSTLA